LQSIRDYDNMMEFFFAATSGVGINDGMSPAPVINLAPPLATLSSSLD
jgi:hypothetical protein